MSTANPGERGQPLVEGHVQGIVRAHNRMAPTAIKECGGAKSNRDLPALSRKMTFFSNPPAQGIDDLP